METFSRDLECRNRHFHAKFPPQVLSPIILCHMYPRAQTAFDT